MSAAAPYDYRGARGEIFGSHLPGALKLLALALVEFMPNCEPSVLTLAGHCGVERKTVLRAIERLERLGVLLVERSSGRRSRYVLQPRDAWGDLYRRLEAKAITSPDKGPVPEIGTGPEESPAPTATGTGTNGDTGPVPERDGTGTTIEVPEAGKQIQKADRKRDARDAGTKESPVPERHRLGPSRRDQALSAAADALGRLRHRYAPDFSPTRANQARGHELGLTDAEIWQRWDEARDKLYDKPFDSDERQFNRELAWAKADKEKRVFKTQRERDAFEMPGRERHPS